MGTLIIAEAGVNHNGNLETAYKMIDVAKEAGVDIVKSNFSNIDFKIFRKGRVSEERNRSRGNAIGDDKKTSIFICSACSIKRILR